MTFIFRAAIQLVILFLFCTEVANSNELNRLINLSQDSVWRNLVHYEKTSSDLISFESAIHSDDFFLSPEGKYDPLKELSATIYAFSNIEGNQTEKPVHCRFPARLIWLKKMLGNGFAENAKLANCVDFNKWSYQDSVESVSIIFATGYLGNPASFYGHTLLKFNSSKNNGNSLQDSSLNFGAINTQDDNAFLYITKGLFGGYEASFSHIQYYFHNHNYGENEQRDMWEYELNLRPEDVAILVAHAWELLGKKYTYYFLKENCAYRMAELFNIIEGIDISNKNTAWTIPQSLLQTVWSTKYKGNSLVKRIKKHPSRQSRLYSKFRQLEVSEKIIVEDIVSEKIDFSSRAFKSLNLKRKYVVLDALLDYYQLIRDKKALNSDNANLMYQQTLNTRFMLPPGDSAFSLEKEMMYPHEGRSPSLFSVGLITNNTKGSYSTFQFRPAYYDTLDATNGHIAYSHMSMGELKVAVKNDDAFVKYFDIFHVQSINSRATGLPRDTEKAWNIRFGAEQFSPLCLNCSVIRFQGDLGFSYTFKEKFIFAGYVGGAVQETYMNNENYFLRGKLFAQANLMDKLRLKISYEYRSDFNSSNNDLEFFEGTLRYEFFKDRDVRFFYRNSNIHESGISFGFYW
jgi:hypothetical protein